MHLQSPAPRLARIYEVFPLTCPQCGGAMRIIAFIDEGDADPLAQSIPVFEFDQRIAW